MISVEEALEKILGHVNILEAQLQPILECLGQVLAEDLYSSINVPPLDNAAMDGYAIRAGDISSASQQSPRYLHVIDTVAAGAISKRSLEPGTAIRIMTGAPVPEGADTVIPFEFTDEVKGAAPSSTIGILCTAEAGWNIRRAGEDIKRGSLVLPKGTIIRPSEIGVLASLGRSEVMVIRRPIVAILATGDELIPITEPLPPGKIYNSNSYSVAALVKLYGGIPQLLGIARDNEDSMIEKLNRLNADMLLTSGGVSAGDYDIVKDVLARQGEISFWTVRMKPGKPLAFGRFKQTNKAGEVKYTPHLGFPGNPVSAMLTFELFARPAILKMMGKRNLAKPVIDAVMEGSVSNNDGRRMFARVVVEKRNGKYHAQLTGDQGSGILTSMVKANGLAIIPEDRKKVATGETVKVMMLDWSEVN